MKNNKDRTVVLPAFAYRLLFENCEVPMDETNRTLPERHINTALAGLEYGYGFPNLNEITKSNVERYVKEVDGETLREWVDAGYINQVNGADFFDKQTNEFIRKLFKELPITARPWLISVAEADVELPSDDDPEEELEKQMAYLDEMIEQQMDQNPAFGEAAEIFLTGKADGGKCLISVWRCNSF